MKRIIAFFIAALALSAAAPAFAADPVPGVEVGLGQKPGGIVASAPSDSTGTVSFFNLPAGRYQIHVDNTKLTAPAIMTVKVGRDAPITSDPIPVDRTPGVKTSSRGFVVAKGGDALWLVIPASAGAPRGATPKAVSGPLPRDAQGTNTIVVTLTTNQ